MRFGSTAFNLPTAPLLSQAFDEGVLGTVAGVIKLQVGEQLAAEVLKVSPQGVLINLKGSQLLLQGLTGLKPGMEVMVKVVELEPQLSLQIVNSTAAPIGAPLPLQIGQEVIGKILGRLPQGGLLLDVQGTPLEASAPESLSIGTLLSLRVEELGPRWTFQILDQQPELETTALQFLRDHLPDSLSAAQSLERLHNALADLANLPLREDLSSQELAMGLDRLRSLLDQFLPQRTPADAGQLVRFVHDGGLQYEAKLARAVVVAPEELAQVAQGDLKGQILHLLEAVAKVTGPAEASHLAAPLDNHLDHIETQQALNVLAQANGAPLQLQIPFLSPQGLSTAFLSVEPDAQGSADADPSNSGHHVMLQFDVEELGQTSVDAYVTPQTARVIFYVEQKSGLELLQTELSAFRAELQKRFDFRDVLLAARPLARLSPAKREAFAVLSAGIPANVNLIDVRA